MAILAIDQGTTGTRAILFNRQGKIIGEAYREITQIYPRTGWVEHNPDEILQKTFQVIHQAITKAKLSPLKIAAIGFTNQRETTLIWDQRDGRPIAHAIVWQCRRSAEICERLKKWKLQALFQKKTGLVLDPYFSGTKLTWLFENIPQARALAKTGHLRFGTIDSWLLWHLTGGKTHATDYTNASRTLLLNLKTLQWDPILQKILRVPASILPAIRPSSGIFGETVKVGVNGRSPLPSGIPIAGIAGDQQSSLFGQGCYNPGTLKNTYGTGCFLLLNTGKKLIYSKNGLLTTVAVNASGKPSYALEGSVFIGGAVVQWLRDSLKTIKTSAESERPAARLQDNGGVYFVPAFVGLGAPYWQANARGTLVGLTRGTGREHIIRAALEAIAYQTRDVYETMMQETKDIVDVGAVREPPLHVDGGATANKFLMQFQSDILGKQVTLSPMAQSTAWGAAKLAGLAVGFWNSVEEFQKIEKAKNVFGPQMDPITRERLYLRWKKAIAVSLNYARNNLTGK